jgi:hypothetical protein
VSDEASRALFGLPIEWRRRALMGRIKAERGA